MGFEDWGMTKDESERRKREHKEELERIRREGDAEVSRIYSDMRESRKAHSDYLAWMRQTGRTDVPFEDWKAGRYVHILIR